MFLIKIFYLYLNQQTKQLDMNIQEVAKELEQGFKVYATCENGTIEAEVETTNGMLYFNGTFYDHELVFQFSEHDELSFSTESEKFEFDDNDLEELSKTEIYLKLRNEVSTPYIEWEIHYKD